MLFGLGFTVVLAVGIGVFYVVDQKTGTVNLWGQSVSVSDIKNMLFMTESKQLGGLQDKNDGMDGNMPRVDETAKGQNKEKVHRQAAKILEREKLEAERRRQEMARLEKERLEAERQRKEAERLEKERLEAQRRQEEERLEKERLEAQRKQQEAERLENERLEAERQRLEAERLEKERLETERKRQEAERLETERQRQEAERLEKERLEAERKRQEAERLEMKRLEAEKQRQEAERLEKDRLDAERQRQESERLEKLRLEAERQRQEAERLENERVLAERQRQEAEKLEEERLMAERQRQGETDKLAAERQREEVDRFQKERKEHERQRQETEQLQNARLEAERLQKERLEAERLQKERQEAERQRQEAERLQKEKLEAERLEAERLQKEKLEAERQRQEAERLQKENLEAERLQRERLEAERLQKEAEMMKAEKLQRDKLEAERQEAERMQREKVEAERQKQEVERIQREKLEAERQRQEVERIQRDRLETQKQKEEAERMKKTPSDSKRVPSENHEPVHLSVVACGDRLEETIVMIKSALIFSKAMLHVHIFADKDLQPQFKSELDKVPDDIKKRFQAHIHDIQYPPGYDENEWRQLFKTCATQRLFIPDILLDVDRLLYVDTDVLFLRPIEDIWDFFHQFNSTQIVGLSWEHEEGSAAWYNRFARHPYYPPFGLNSGVMLMDLPGLRRKQWTTLMEKYYQEYKLRITWGDQDLINIFFHYYPEMLYVFSCEYNYRPDHCMYTQTCRKVAENGISVLHGCRGVYHNEKHLVFKAVYRAFKEYEFSKDLDGDFLQKLLKYVTDSENAKDRCYQEVNLFTKRLIMSVNDVLQEGDKS